MRLALQPAPWVSARPSAALVACSSILDGVWREVAIEFYAVRAARLAKGRQAPKGVQSFINAALDVRFEEAGWEGTGGRYRFEDAWLRVTFRHSMSLGADFLDALRLTRKEGVAQVAIVAASADFLQLITPNDAAALVSFERLMSQAVELDGVFDFDLFVGRLTPVSTLPVEVAVALARERPRDTYQPT